VVLFDHGILHAAEAVSEGVKYVARIDGHLSLFADSRVRIGEPSPGND
jgi:hypothetical protein